MRVAGPIATSPAELTAARSAAGRDGWSRRTALAQLRGRFAEAAGRSGTIERSFRIGGLAVAARFAGPALVPAIEPALAHLLIEQPSPKPDLLVELWDSASTGIEVPPRNGESPASGPGDADLVRSSYHLEPRILTLYDPAEGVAVIWVPDARTVPSNEVASPMRTLLHWFARDHGLQFVHAGALGLDGRAVLLAGPSGAGKSTTALVGLLAGLDYLGDDYVLVDARGGAAIHSLFSAAKLQPEQVDTFPALRPLLTNADRLADEKALWFVHRDFPGQTRASATAVAVLVPRVSGARESAVTPIPRGKALAALAPSTIVQLSGADQWSLTAIAAFLQRVPTYQLEAGTDLEGLAAAVRGVLQKRPA